MHHADTIVLRSTYEYHADASEHVNHSVPCIRNITVPYFSLIIRRYEIWQCRTLYWSWSICTCSSFHV